MTGIGANVFRETPVTITCGCGSAAHVYAAGNNVSVSPIHHYVDGWCTVCGVPENYIDNGPCGAQGNNVMWYMTDDGTLYLWGIGAMADYDSSSLPWYDQRGSVKSVRIGSGVTYIGICAFNKCSQLADVSIPGSVTRIGLRAFWDCASLKEITIPDSVVTLDAGIFLDTPVTVTCGCDSYAQAIGPPVVYCVVTVF